MKHLLRLTALTLALGLASAAAQDAKPAKKQPAKKAPAANAGQAINENKATPLERIKVLKDFKVELLHSVPNAYK